MNPSLNGTPPHIDAVTVGEGGAYHDKIEEIRDILIGVFALHYTQLLSSNGQEYNQCDSLMSSATRQV